MTTILIDYFVIKNVEQKVKEHGWELEVHQEFIYLWRDKRGAPTKFASFSTIYDWICGYEFGEAEGFTKGAKKLIGQENAIVKQHRKKV